MMNERYIESYDVYWKDEYIGKLTVNTTTGNHSYVPNLSKIYSSIF